MELIQSIQTINLDKLTDDAIVTLTSNGSRLVLSKAQLFAKLSKKPRAPTVKARATRVKA